MQGLPLAGTLRAIHLACNHSLTLHLHLLVWLSGPRAFFHFHIHFTMTTTAHAFPHGQLYQTSRMFDAACEHRPFAIFIHSCITRHLMGDWGDLCDEDRDRNDVALQGGNRLFSVYEIPQGLFGLESKIWIITESDRAYTTVLFPSEY